MKLYHLFFLVFIMQILFVLPFERSIEVWNNSVSEEEAYNYLRSQGLGPTITWKSGYAIITEPGPSGGNSGISEVFHADYLGNTFLNFSLLGCVYSLYKLKREKK
jgi:hypothetical protein